MDFRRGILPHRKGCYHAIRPKPRATVQNIYFPFDHLDGVDSPLRRGSEDGGRPKLYGRR